MIEADRPIIYQGGCHCGSVRFRVAVRKQEAIACNCSICYKKGFLYLIVSPEEFTLLQGADVLATYRFNTHTARHTFCRICGIHPFCRTRAHPQAIDINLRCLDGDVLSRFALQPFDGVHWEENIEGLHHPTAAARQSNK